MFNSGGNYGNGTNAGVGYSNGNWTNTKGGIVYDMNIRQAETDDPADFEPENNTDTGEGIG